jgi:hypothetical protein
MRYIRQNQNSTATAVSLKTLMAGASATSRFEQTRQSLTAAGNAQQTRTANTTATASAKAAIQTAANIRTQTAVNQATSEASKISPPFPGLVVKFGPKNGSLKHDPSDTYIELYSANISVADFVAQVVFYVPYSTSKGSWDFGFLFRDAGKNEDYRLSVTSDLKWYLSNRTSAGSKQIASGNVSNLNTGAGMPNVLLLECKGSSGKLTINGKFVATLNLGARLNAGDVSVATGIYEGDEVTGMETRYENFIIWVYAP